MDVGDWLGVAGFVFGGGSFGVLIRLFLSHRDKHAAIEAKLSEHDAKLAAGAVKFERLERKVDDLREGVDEVRSGVREILVDLRRRRPGEGLFGNGQ